MIPNDNFTNIIKLYLLFVLSARAVADAAAVVVVAVVADVADVVVVAVDVVLGLSVIRKIDLSVLLFTFENNIFIEQLAFLGTTQI